MELQNSKIRRSYLGSAVHRYEQISPSDLPAVSSLVLSYGAGSRSSMRPLSSPAEFSTMMRLAPAFALSRGAPVTFRHAGARTAIRMLSAAAPGPKVRSMLKLCSDHFG
jgi:hypothetical protein